MPGLIKFWTKFLIKSSKSCPGKGTTDVWDLWLQAPRGSIERFGDYQEWLGDGEISNYKEFQEIWLSCFPDEEYWYSFTAIERKEERYRGIFLIHRMMIEQRGEPTAGVPLDIYEFAEWLLWSVNVCIDDLKAGTYNQFIEAHLPIQFRIGTILRKDWWSVLPEFQKEFFSGLSGGYRHFCKIYGRKQPAKYHRTTLGRVECERLFSGVRNWLCRKSLLRRRRTPREQYYLHADGRDGGLGEVDPDSPSAFLSWFTDQYDGHPWEVVQGGNSTHISLYPQYEGDSFTFLLVGSSVSRTVETVKFYLALRKAGLPVYIREGTILADWLTDNEKRCAASSFIRT